MSSGSARADGYAPIESPAMDSLPVFAATLDPEDGGCFTLPQGLSHLALRNAAALLHA